MHMLDMQCYAHVVLCACCTCGAMYIWCCVHDCTSGTMSMWCCVHVVHIVLCTWVMCTCRAYGTVYMWCMWCCVRPMLCTRCRVGIMYMWNCVHIVQVVQCTCGILYMWCRWCRVYVMLSTCCVGGVVYMRHHVHVPHMVQVYMRYYTNVVHVVMQACDTMYFHCVAVVLGLRTILKIHPLSLHAHTFSPLFHHHVITSASLSSLNGLPFFFPKYY